jgi:hypothetical protein
MENILGTQLEAAFQHFEDAHLAAFASQVEAARELYRKYPDLITSEELRPDLSAVLPLAETRGIEAEDVMTDPNWRETVRSESHELAVYVAAQRA